MKKKALALMLLAVMGLVGLSGGVAQAGWETASILQVGSTGTNYWLTASSTTSTPPFSNITFIIDESNGRGKEMFATALTAFASSTNVQIWVDAPFDNYTIAWGVIASK